MVLKEKKMQSRSIHFTSCLRLLEPNVHCNLVTFFPFLMLTITWCVFCFFVQYEQLTQMKSVFETKMQRQHELSEVKHTCKDGGDLPRCQDFAYLCCV